jgi:hypothetical protein
MTMRTEVLLTRVSRFTAWTALTVIALFVVSGYGMTKRIIDPDVGKILHQRILPIPLFVAVLVHGGVCARRSLYRWHVFANRAAVNLYVTLVCAVLLALFLWMHLGVKP